MTGLPAVVVATAAMAKPSVELIMTPGMLTVLSRPPITIGPTREGLAPSLKTTIALAPAACAAVYLTRKVHVPRSMSAILPAIAAPLVSGAQPLMGSAATTPAEIGPPTFNNTRPAPSGLHLKPPRLGRA